MTKKPNHRVAAGTKAARQMAARTGNFYSPALNQDPALKREIAAWNAAVEAKKLAKKGAQK